MAKTYGQYETLVRREISDSSPEYRWPSRVVLGYLSDALKYLRAIRPEARYDGLTLVPNPTYPDLSGTGTDGIESAQSVEISIQANWEQGLVYYAAAKCLEEDSGDAANSALSTDFFSKAVAIFQT